MARIWIIGSEALDMGNLTPVAKEMWRRGHEVIISASDVFAIKLAEDNMKSLAEGRVPLPFLGFFTDDKLLALPPPRLVLTGIALRPNFGLNLVNSSNYGVKVTTVTLQGGYSGKPYYGRDGYVPDLFLVNDSVSEQIVRQWNATLSPDQVIIVGNPHFDSLANANQGDSAMAMRAELGIKDDLPIVLYAGSVCGTPEHFKIYSEGTGLSIVVRAVNVLRSRGLRFHLIVRPHPRLIKDPSRCVPGEREAWDQALGELSIPPIDSKTLETSGVLAISNTLVAQPGSVLTEAAVMRKNAITLGGDALERYYKQWETSILPPLELGCCALSSNSEHLANLLSQALTDGLDLREAQEHTYKTDGKNTERVCDYLEMLLN